MLQVETALLTLPGLVDFSARCLGPRASSSWTSCCWFPEFPRSTVSAEQHHLGTASGKRPLSHEARREERSADGGSDGAGSGKEAMLTERREGEEQPPVRHIAWMPIGFRRRGFPSCFRRL